MSNNQHLTLVKIWSDTFGSIKKTSRLSASFALYMIILPLSCFTILFAKLSHPVTKKIKTLVDGFNQEQLSLSYQMIIEPSSQFFSLYLVCHLVFIIFAIATFFGVVLSAISVYKDPTSKKLTFVSLLASGFKYVFFKGFVVLFGVLIVSSEQLILGPFRIFSVLTLVSVVLIIVEKKNSFSALSHALFLKYISKSKGTGLSTFFIVLSSAAIIYLYELGVAIIAKNILILDQWLNISNHFWTYKLPGFPCSLIYLTTQIFTIIAYAALTIFYAHFIVCLYISVCKKTSERT